MEPTLCCPKCGHAAFVQIERRKIKVGIIGGEAVVHSGHESLANILFACSRCGEIMPRELASKIRFKTQFSESLN